MPPGLRVRATPLPASEARRLRDRNAAILRGSLFAYLGLLAVTALGSGVPLTPDVALIGAALAATLVLRRSLVSYRWPAAEEWLPILILALAYELIRGVGPVLIERVDIDSIPGIERLLFGGQLATERLQQAIRPIAGVDPVAVGATIIYVLHTALPIVIGAYLWLRHRRLFYDFMAALVVLSLAAFATYVLFPVAPPWWAAATGHLAGPDGQPLITHLKPGAFDALVTSAGFDGRALFSLTFGEISPDPVAAFPSLHAAYPFLAYLFLRRLGAVPRSLMLAYTLAAWFAIVYLGDHYVVDVLAGAAYAAVAFSLVPISQIHPWLATRRVRGWLLAAIECFATPHPVARLFAGLLAGPVVPLTAQRSIPIAERAA